MNIWGYERKLKSARYVIEKEYLKGQNRNNQKIERLHRTMKNIRRKIRKIKEKRSHEHN